MIVNINKQLGRHKGLEQHEQREHRWSDDERNLFKEVIDLANMAKNNEEYRKDFIIMQEKWWKGGWFTKNEIRNPNATARHKKNDTFLTQIFNNEYYKYSLAQHLMRTVNRKNKPSKRKQTSSNDGSGSDRGGSSDKRIRGGGRVVQLLQKLTLRF